MLLCGIMNSVNLTDGIDGLASSVTSVVALFFGAADEILKVSEETGKNCIVLRMKGVTAIDSTGLRNLERIYAQCSDAGITLILSHLNEQPRKTLEKAGLLSRIGEKNICPEINAALSRAAELAE